MTFAYIIGILTVVTSLAVKIIGYPTQIMKIHKNKNVDNLSITLAIISFVTYICWTIHGIIKNDVVVIAGQSLGIVTSGILLFQILKYRNTNHKN
ncbi:hypothetical protein J4771_00865 [Candidatus Kaistella beijingensis]|uniref:SWEET family sugar transporter n=1 Tax=Candidatus Kaistella beijingensis TaxID=2820270 RepID=UPI001CC49E6C|nr:SWEET family sugar transporter [Candidatus Kaistella beijingensis]UBB89934.1 hypothetical protein J4771_00865 [Candidatus Kaistella beijingensis]